MRQALRTALTAASGVALLAAAGGVLGVGAQRPVTSTPVSATTLAVPATTSVHVCAGPPRLATAAVGEDLAYDEFDPAGSGTASAVGALALAVEGRPPAPARIADLADTDPVELTLTGDSRLGSATDAGEALVLRAEPVAGRAAAATGTSLALTTAGDLRGLTATACQAPAAAAWLVGGSTEPGASAQLVLANAGATPATVTLHGWGSTGPLDTSGAGSVLVPPGSTRVVLLEAVVPAEPRLALRLESTGGEVTAHLQDSRLQGLVPHGTDLLTPGAAPAEEVVVPGVVLDETAATDPAPPVLRIVNPGPDEVRAGVELLGPDGPLAVPGAEDLVLDPGVVLDVSLAGLPPGAWAARVRADAPVTAAAMLTSPGQDATGPGSPPIDRAWVAASSDLAHGMVALPDLDLATATLVVTNPAEQPSTATVHPVLPDGTLGEPVTVEIPAGGSTTHDLRAAGPLAGARLAAAEGSTLHAAVHLTAAAPDGTVLSVLPVSPDTEAARAVAIAPAPRELG